LPIYTGSVPTAGRPCLAPRLVWWLLRAGISAVTTTSLAGLGTLPRIGLSARLFTSIRLPGLTAAGLLTAGLLITPTLIAILRRFPWLLACTRFTSLALTRFLLPTGLLITAVLIAPGLSRLTGLTLTGLLLVTCLATRTGLASTARTTRFLT
jgi:hypothetical protein